MSGEFILDAGPFVAFLDKNDAQHAWAVQQSARMKPPFLTCEAVLSETCFLMRGLVSGPAAAVEAIRRGTVVIPFRLADHAARVRQLMAKYSQLPMSLADACLVCMAETLPESTVFTTDRHFRIYRKHGRTVIPVLMPNE